MKTEKIEITKINIQVKDTKLELTLDEAKELKKALESLFPKPEIEHVYMDRYIDSPWRYWKYDIIPYLTCESGSSGGMDTTPQVYCANLNLVD